MRQKGFAPIALVIVLAIVGIIAAYYFGTLNKKGDQPQPTSTPTPNGTVSPSPVTKPTIISAKDGASLSGIKYTLPPTWEAKLTTESLMLSPKSGGGYLNIKVRGVIMDIGITDAYCQVVGYCIKETYFTKMNIGNISGYKADALDNSGGGPDYFGTKGSKFYLISSYNPPSPNEFENTYKEVLNSLIF